MAEREERRRTIRQHDVGHEAAEVALIVAEVPDMTFQRIAGEPARSALPAPIHDGDGKPATAKLTRHLEIFLDEFAAAGKDADRAAPLLQRRGPTCIAYPHILLDFEKAGRRSERDRVLRCRDEVHEMLLS